MLIIATTLQNSHPELLITLLMIGNVIVLIAPMVYIQRKVNQENFNVIDVDAKNYNSTKQTLLKRTHFSTLLFFIVFHLIASWQTLSSNGNFIANIFSIKQIVTSLIASIFFWILIRLTSLRHISVVADED